uniref:DNA topoisomerase I n=1 Tax=Nannospalax galili TaxID=1026970 RepID=A0A8C6QBY4_NANGA
MRRSPGRPFQHVPLPVPFGPASRGAKTCRAGRAKGGVKWRQLEHRGPSCLLSAGKPMKVSLAAEEVATFYGKMLHLEYMTKEVFQDNFFNDWRKVSLVATAATLDLAGGTLWGECPGCYLKKLQKFGYCILDGHREKLMEPPGLFCGRGDHPKMGMLKRTVMPEDVIINCSRDSKIPDPPASHQWKEVHSDHTVMWLAAWIENVQKSIKYVMLTPSSKLKGERDWQKCEVGAVDEIYAQYQADWQSPEMKKRQRVLALYFIDKLVLQTGNKEEEGETADTVGCCSLRGEHIWLHAQADGREHVVELDFLGKGSICYHNRVTVEKLVFRNLQQFMEGKDPGDDLFDALTTSSLNRHLQDLMDGLTAKVFWTYSASITLQEQLWSLTSAEDSLHSKVLAYNWANWAVAILCNHQRATPKTFEKLMQTPDKGIETKKAQVAEAQEELEKVKADLRKGG